MVVKGLKKFLEFLLCEESVEAFGFW